VGDKQAGGAKLSLQLFEQTNDARLEHQVEVRHRLIKDQQLRLNRQRARQADALQLSAAQLRGRLSSTLSSRSTA
jgi:hypothetical protein